MQPFNTGFLWIALIFTGAYFLTGLVPEMKLIPDIIVRSGIYSLIIVIVVYFSGVSKDINEMVNKFFKK